MTDDQITAIERGAQIRALKSLQMMYSGDDVTCAEDEIAARVQDIQRKIEALESGGEPL